jgi:uncharacterized membrane protein (DUF106 family)
MEILKYVVLGAVVTFVLLFITGQLKMTERYESGDEIQAEIDKLLKELDMGEVEQAEDSDDEEEPDTVSMAPGPMGMGDDSDSDEE